MAAFAKANARRPGAPERAQMALEADPKLKRKAKANATPERAQMALEADPKFERKEVMLFQLKL